MNKQDMRVLDQVLRTVSRYKMLAEAARAGVAVSGGADSVALLHILVRLAGPRRWALEVLHFDHGLRGEESDGDRRFVEEMAARLGLPCHVEGANVRVAAMGANLEQTARQMRYRFFKEVRERRGLDVVATGHTASDQAETVLMRVLRGAAAESLAGIRPVNDGWIVRPLIEATRENVRGWLRAEGLEWREDSSNIDSCYDRNRMRHELLPLLRREWNPAVEEALARMATAFARDEEYWETQVEAVWAAAAARSRFGVVVDLQALGEAHAALQVRVWKRACAEAAGAAPRIEGEHLEALLKLARQRAGAGKLSLPGVRVWRSFHQVLIHPADRTFEQRPGVELGVPGEAVLEEAGARIRLRRAEPGAEAYNGISERLGGAVAEGPFMLRTWQDGDAYRPRGSRERRTIQALLQNCRVPAWERCRWPVLEWRGRVVWTRQFGVAAEFAAEDGGEFPIEILEEPPRPGE
jgi:tRNA(Ile)-lysidine synthase